MGKSHGRKEVKEQKAERPGSCVAVLLGQGINPDIEKTRATLMPSSGGSLGFSGDRTGSDLSR